MVDILHRVGMKSASLDEVYAALTTLEGLSGWWATDTKGQPEVGGILAFRFELGPIDMKVLELNPAESVLWEVTDGPAEWIGTTVRWDLKQEGDYTIVLFAHEGWKERVEFMYHCSTKWATFLMSSSSSSRQVPVRPSRTTSGSPTGTEVIRPASLVLKLLLPGVDHVAEHAVDVPDIPG